MSSLLKEIPTASQNTELQLRDKTALFLLDITELEDVFQERLWWDLSSHGHSNHKNKPMVKYMTCMLVSHCLVIHITNWLLLSDNAY